MIFIQTAFGQNYIDYYKGVSEAQQEAADSNYSNALEIYYNTFEQYTFRFARDCYNAVEISALTTDSAKMNYFIRCSLKQGIPISVFKNASFLEEYRETKHWAGVIKSSDSLFHIYSSSINLDIRNEITQMFAADQQIRMRYYKWYNILIRPFLSRKWKNLNRAQVHRIMEITKEFGFPGERLIGVDLPSMHPKIHSLQLSAGMPILLFIHHFSQPNPSFDSFLFEQIGTGHLWNQHFVTICNFEATYGKNKHDSFGAHSLMFQSKHQAIHEINNRRIKIRVPTLNDEQKIEQSPVFTHFHNRLY